MLVLLGLPFGVPDREGGGGTLRTKSSALLPLFEAREEVRGLTANTIVPVPTRRACGDDLIAAITAIVPPNWIDAAAKDQSAAIGPLAAWRATKHSVISNCAYLREVV